MTDRISVIEALRLNSELSEDELDEASVSPSTIGNIVDVEYHGDFISPSYLKTKSEFFHPVGVGERLRCRLERLQSKGITATTYNLYLETSGGSSTHQLVMSAKKSLSKESRYVVEMVSPQSSSTEGNIRLGRVKSNLLGNSFSILQFNGGIDYDDVAAVEYETRISAHKAPRKLKVIIPSVDGTKMQPFQPNLDERAVPLQDRVKNGNEKRNYLVLSNKPPVWNEEAASYTLNFDGRVSLASVKNFQIIHDQDTEYIALQSGRLSQNAFNLDIRYPFSLFQAFAIVLTSFDPKLSGK